MQEAWAGWGDDARLILLPAREAEVMPGVPWGSPEHFNTPAYWAVRCQWTGENPDFVTRECIVRETAFCLLGGFGIRYEVNVAAYERLDERGFFNGAQPDESEIRNWLLEPLAVEGRLMRYRFPNQRAKRLAGICNTLAVDHLACLNAAQLREALLAIKGIGPKTASWIVRNCTGSDDVAILDVHLIRACQQMRVFPSVLSLPRDYLDLEALFLRFSGAIHVRPSVLDAVMWTEARKSRSLAAAR